MCNVYNGQSPEFEQHHTRVTVPGASDSLYLVHSLISGLPGNQRTYSYAHTTSAGSSTGV